MKKRYLLLLFTVFITATAHTQTITNIRASQDDQDILVTYDLRADDNNLKFTTQLYLSTDGGRTYSGPLQQVFGDVGPGITAGLNKRIRWQVLDERERLQGDNIQFKVTATYSDRLPFQPEMVFVEGGTFQMGSNNGASDEKPIHPVTLSDFYIGKYEVTNAQFCAFLNEKGNREGGGAEWIDLDGSYSNEKCRIIRRGNRFEVERGYEDHPVIYVSWFGARAFCDWLKEKTGKNYQLPTEAQWEFAARGGNKSLGYNYAGSDNLDAVGWYDDNSGGGTHLVGQKRPNELGIYDMSGNVWEWCQDWYGNYSGRAQRNPTGASSGSSRVNRGGSWDFGARSCRVTYRGRTDPVYRISFLGFRVILP
jgi:formylglycine-generating enzyme required for sulfatase activity